jgi:hypothetical protein
MPNILGAIGRMFEGLSAGSPLGKAGIVLGSLITSIYSPIVALLAACFALTVADLFYGIKVAYKFKQKITSDKSWKGTITKLLDEWAVISLARLLEYSVLGADQGVFILTGGITVIIGLTELWSILENLNTLNPDGPWRSLGVFLKKKSEEYVGTEIDLNDDDTNNNKVDSSES